MRRDIVWERTGAMGMEHLTLEIGADAVRADGLVLMQLDDGMIRLRYAIRLGGDWRTRSAYLALDRGGGAKAVMIERDGERWLVDGGVRPDLAGAVDIDVAATPFTNAMPIRRLAPGATERIRVAYVSVPDLEVRPAGQEYAHLGPGRYHYRGLDTGFEAAITADEDGVVVDYPPIWQRRAG
jgi:hypothetical protein